MEKLASAEERRECQRQEEISRLRAASERVDAVLAMSRQKKEREMKRIHAKLEVNILPIGLLYGPEGRISP